LHYAGPSGYVPTFDEIQQRNTPKIERTKMPNDPHTITMELGSLDARLLLQLLEDQRVKAIAGEHYAANAVDKVIEALRQAGAG
jgi:hypothetical protein